MGAASATPPAARRAERSGSGPAVLSRQWVYILPTRHGVAFFVVVFVMLIGSINYNNSLGFLLTFLLAGLGLVAILHTYKNLAGLMLEVRRASSVFAGDQARFLIHLDNQGQRERLGLVISHSRPGADARPELSLAHFDVPEDAPARVELAIPTARRGRLHLGRITVATRYPLGLFRAWSHVDTQAACIVYPRPAGERRLPLDEADAARHVGSQFPGTDDFAGLRNYAPGDSSRRIHWKAVAKDRDIPVKQFTGVAAERVRISWEAARQDDLEAKLSQLSRWVMEANAAGLDFALLLPERSIPAASGAPHRHACLRALALYGEPDG